MDIVHREDAGQRGREGRGRRYGAGTGDDEPFIVKFHQAREPLGVRRGAHHDEQRTRVHDAVRPGLAARMVSASRWSAPCNALTSAPYSIVIRGSASSRMPMRYGEEILTARGGRRGRQESRGGIRNQSDAEEADSCSCGVDQVFSAAPHTPNFRLLSIKRPGRALGVKSAELAPQCATLRQTAGQMCVLIQV